jgi:hypothetical protein
MKNLNAVKRFTIVLYVFVFAIVVVGCSSNFKNLTPKDAVIKANERLKQTKGYRMKIETMLNIKDIRQKVIFEGEVQNPGVVHLKGDLMGMELEIYQKDDAFFIKNPFTGKWTESRDIGIAEVDNIIKTPGETFDDLKALIVEAEYLPDEKLGDIDCKVVRYLPDREKIAKIINGKSSNEIKYKQYTFKAWIGKKDFLIHKMNVDIVLYAGKIGEQTINMTIYYFDFNAKDIDVQLPPELLSQAKN